MSNSKLISCMLISPNRTSPRNHEIDTVTIHCMEGQLTAKECINLSRFVIYDPKSGASCNYAVGKDGSIGICVDEKDRSWCSSSSSNDHRAITIEVASDKNDPYAVNDKAYEALIQLLVDIVQRNPGFGGSLRWTPNKADIGDTKVQNMTVHRWFANKSCPGDYLYYHMGEIANEVNRRLNAEVDVSPLPDSFTPVAPNPPIFEPYVVAITATSLNYRSGPGVSYPAKGQISAPTKYTIVEESADKKWGKLKSGAGWISLAYTKRA
ncbi:hypothetical protein FACS189490_12080 [Clostridia bacterium]|nr:hypothetical protein FACS189490_12080 [Clostridia bacterium]